MQTVSIKNWNNKLFSIAPTRIIVVSFALIIVFGAFLLTLPIASKSGHTAGFLNSLFTATSATCVTGLVVYDTYNHWSLFGQVVILLMIQCGGLGIITLGTFFMVLLGRKVGLKGRILAQESISNFSFDGVLRLILRVVVVTLSIELLGAIILSFSLVPKFGAKGLYLSLFHSVSAFCNAGFDLMGVLGKGDFVSLTSFNNDPLVIYTIPALIITGGLGFVVWKDIYEYPKNKHFQLHTKMVLSITLLLILLGGVFFFSIEYNNPLTMGNFTTFEKINASFFHSVTTRTAGYNSVPLNDMMEISKVVTVIMMFIGAAPGSTGGGIKVTTFGVILFAIISQIRGSSETVIFRRRVPHIIVSKSLAIIGLSGTLVIFIATLLLLVEKTPFITALYEATSAFGTVGLSCNLTPTLSSFSKALLIFTMFLGRVGPLTFALALALRGSKKDADMVYPEGKVIVG